MMYQDEIMHELEIAVKKGSSLLDNVLPDWADNIDNTELDMSSLLDCILGQLYGTFMVGVQTLGVDADENGFVADDIGDYYELGIHQKRVVYDWLTSLWNDEIDYRVEGV